jgi:SAM-dependent methyltransferase
MGLASWHFQCSVCGLEASTLEPTDLTADDRVVNEVDREVGLESLRKQGFSETFRVLCKFKTEGRLLDVGCAHGWFLDAGRGAGFDCVGIEPSTRVAERATQRGHRVLSGYFPSALSAGESFDVVSFNDVFEHIPDANSVMESISAALRQDGVLSIAIPSNRGFFYRLSRSLARLGAIGPFERMWQKQFSSPHVYYFNADVLTTIARRHGFEPLFQGSLPSVRLRGLWDRLTYDTGASLVKNMAVYALVVVALPFLRILPADIDLLMYRKI